MTIRMRHLFLHIGYSADQDADHTLTLCLFRRKDAAEGHSRYRFTFHCGMDRPRFRKNYGFSEYSDVLGAVNSARWTGRDYEITGWLWPVWLNARLGRHYVCWRLWPITWTPSWLKSKRRMARRRQMILNSTMTAASIQLGRYASDREVEELARHLAGL